jgi:hypothetical protein
MTETTREHVLEFEQVEGNSYLVKARTFRDGKFQEIKVIAIPEDEMEATEVESNSMHTADTER